VNTLSDAKPTKQWKKKLKLNSMFVVTMRLSRSSLHYAFGYCAHLQLFTSFSYFVKIFSVFKHLMQSFLLSGDYIPECGTCQCH